MGTSRLGHGEHGGDRPGPGGSQLLGPWELCQGQEENPAQVFVAKAKLAAVPSAPGGFAGEEPRARLSPPVPT